MTGNGISQAAEYIDCREIDDWLFKPFGIQALSNVIMDLGLPNAFAAGMAPRKASAGSAFERFRRREPSGNCCHGLTFWNRTRSDEFKRSSSAAGRGF